jgi:hypothetical protein
MPPAAIAIGSLAVAAVGTGYSIYQGERASKQAKKATQLQRQASDLQAVRQKRDAVRQARLAYAQAQAAAENQNVSSSSAAQGGQGSIVSQLQDNLSFLDQYGFFQDQASRALGKAQTYEKSSRMAAQVSGAALNIFQNSDDIGKSLKNIFG